MVTLDDESERSQLKIQNIKKSIQVCAHDRFIKLSKIIVFITNR